MRENRARIDLKTKNIQVLMQSNPSTTVECLSSTMVRTQLLFRDSKTNEDPDKKRQSIYTTGDEALKKEIFRPRNFLYYEPFSTKRSTL